MPVTSGKIDQYIYRESIRLDDAIKIRLGIPEHELMEFMRGNNQLDIEYGHFSELPDSPG